MSRKPFLIAVAMLLLAVVSARAADNLVPDPSFEEPKEKDRWGHVFEKWTGWIYEGECELSLIHI